jgi:hypothetical protein
MTCTVIWSVPLLPSESATDSANRCSPGERRTISSTPLPNAPSRLDVQAYGPPPGPSSESAAVPSSCSGSPARTVHPSRGLTMATCGDASDILYGVTDSTVYLRKGGVYLDTCLAPDACARLEADATLIGALYGNEVKVLDRAQVIGMPAVVVLASAFAAPDVDDPSVLPQHTCTAGEQGQIQ